MADVLERLAPLLRRRDVRFALGLVSAGLYYGIVVAGEIGRTGSILLSAIPPALALVCWYSRPGLALILSATGILLVVWLMTNGSYIQNVAQQSAVLVALFGGALSDRVRIRRAAVVLAVATALLVVPFVYSRYGGQDGYAGEATGFGLGLIALPFVALALGVAARHVLERTGRLGGELAAAHDREQVAERDVLIELERNRIAREVHDVVAHSLAVVIAQADGARFAAESKPETVAPALEAIGDTARRALGEVRTMLHDLRTSGDGAAPGAADLDALVAGVRELGVRVDRDVWGDPAALDRAAGLALYRIAQEALTNALRHGDRGEPVGFELDWGERQVVLVVTNAVTDGVPAPTERAGQGIVGMRERASDAGGDCTAGLGSNGRFRVRVVLPVAPPAPEPAPQPAGDPLTALFGRLGPESHA